MEYGSGPLLPRMIAYAAEQLHQQVSGRSHLHNGWLNTDQEKDGRRWPPGYEPGAIRIVRDHLLRRLVYLHTISSAAVQLCHDGDPKVIRLLSEGFLVGVKGDRARLSLQYSRLTADDCAIAGPPIGFRRLKSIKRCSYPRGYPIDYSMAIQRTDG